MGQKRSSHALLALEFVSVGLGKEKNEGFNSSSKTVARGFGAEKMRREGDLIKQAAAKNATSSGRRTLTAVNEASIWLTAKKTSRRVDQRNRGSSMESDLEIGSIAMATREML